MEKENLILFDGVKWYIPTAAIRDMEALCPKHLLRLSTGRLNEYIARSLACEECDEEYIFPKRRSLHEEKEYILNKIDSKVFKKMKFINLDDEAIPMAEIKISSEDNNYFVTGLLTRSKVGLRLVLYAGEKGSNRKTQIFVEPEIKRLAFDQKDLHPTDIFTKVEAVFEDNTKQSIDK